METHSDKQKKLSIISDKITCDSSLSNLMFKKDIKLKIGAITTSMFLSVSIIIAICRSCLIKVVLFSLLFHVF